MPKLSQLLVMLVMVLLTGCGGGGGGTTPDPKPVPKDELPVLYVASLSSSTTTLRDRAILLNIEVRPEAVGAAPGPAVDTILTVEYSLNAGGVWNNVTELRATGTGKQRGIPQSTPLDLTTRLSFFWDAESDLRLAGAESREIDVVLRVRAEQARGPGLNFSNQITFQVNWSPTGGCVVNAPSYQSGKELTLEAGKPVNAQMLSAGGDLPLVWSVNGALPGSLTLDPSGALTGTPTVFDGVLLFTVRDTCSTGPRRDFALVRLRVIPPECESLSFGTELTIPPGTVGREYNQNLRPLLLSDGKGVLTWTLESGSRLPTGVSLTPTGFLQGTPVDGSAGFYPFRVRVEDQCSTKQKETEQLLLVVGN